MLWRTKILESFGERANEATFGLISDSGLMELANTWIKQKLQKVQGRIAILREHNQSNITYEQIS